VVSEVIPNLIPANFFPRDSLLILRFSIPVSRVSVRRLMRNFRIRRRDRPQAGSVLHLKKCCFSQSKEKKKVSRGLVDSSCHFDAQGDGAAAVLERDLESRW
jgi:hypothetical protein